MGACHAATEGSVAWEVLSLVVPHLRHPPQGLRDQVEDLAEGLAEDPLSPPVPTAFFLRVLQPRPLPARLQWLSYLGERNSSDQTGAKYSHCPNITINYNYGIQTS